MFKQLALCFLLLQSIPSQCLRGCLRCENESAISGKKICTLCDTLTGYQYTETGCNKIDSPNCTKLLSSGECSQCASKYKLDLSTKKCVAVVTAAIIENCNLYNQDGSCFVCNQDFLLLNNKCTAITTKISNCLIYQDQLKCQICNFGYLLKTDYTCTAYPTLCRNYSKFECSECSTGYLYNKNTHLTGLLNFLTNVNRDKVLSEIEDQKNDYIYNQDNTVCQKTTVVGCEKLKTFDTCETCSSGRYLDSKKQCVLYPNQLIPFCQIYSTLTKCKQCLQGYFLKSDSECQQVTQDVNKCILYNQTSNSSLCTQCDVGYYLSGTNSCIIRTKIFELCKTYTTNADKCSVCQENYKLSQQGEQCLPFLANCSTYSEFQSPATTLTCTKCTDLYYLVSNQCILGTQSNCKVYNFNEDICQECIDKFYRAPNCNNEHPAISDCVDYGANEFHECLKCSSELTAIQPRFKCENKPIISSCKNYFTDRLTCTTCENGFYLSSSTICVAIGKNCKTAINTGVCSECNTGYGLVTEAIATNWDCKPVHAYLNDQCSVLNEDNDDLNNFSCNICKANAFRLDDGNTSFVCIAEENVKYLKTKTIPTISNCIRYNTTTCVVCQSNFFLASNGLSCISNKCQGEGTSKINFTTIKTTSYAISETNKCIIADSTNNGWVYGPNIIVEDQVLLSCHQYITQLDFASIKYSNVNPNANSDNWVSDPLDVYPEVKCPLIDTINHKLNGGAPASFNLANCYYWNLAGTINSTEFQCVNCGWGKAGTTTKGNYNNGNNNFDYLTCSSVNISGCIIGDNSKYKNIPVYFQRLLTCNKCSNTGTSDNIPVLAYEGVATDNPKFNYFKKFNKNNTIGWFETNDTSQTENIFCLDVSTKDSIRSGLSLNNTTNVPDAKIDLIPNCAFALLNLEYNSATFDNSDANIISSVYSSKQALLCISCKPGYKGTLLGGDNIFVRSCAVITNCNLTSSNNTYVNACRECNTNFTHEYETTNNKILWENCVAIPTKLTNCEAYIVASNLCKICKKGYHLNSDSYCEQITVPKCSIFSKAQTQLNSVNLRSYNLYYNQFAPGCVQCESGYRSVIINGNLENSSYCVQNTFVNSTKTTFVTKTDNTISGYIDFCSQYTNETTIKCAVCMPEYILRSDNLKCVKQSDFQNCKIAQNGSSSDCNECQPTFGLVTENAVNICKQQIIAFCSQYNTTTVETSVKCTKCDNKYYLDSTTNSCKEGSILYCLQYFSKDVCTICETNFWPMLKKDETNTARYCYPIDTNLGCKTTKFNFTNENKLELYCDECVNNYALKTEILQTNTTDILSKCLPFNKVTQCMTYNSTQVNLSGSGYSFTCQKCEKEYYLNTERNQYYCIKRTKLSTNCQVYETTSDKCQTCITGTFLNATSDDCILNPYGIFKCRIFSSDTKCDKCEENYYISENQCVLIEEAKRITQCKYYTNLTTCELCQNDYLLANNVCSKKNVLNCLTFLTINSCQVCNAGFVLDKQNDVNICKQFSILNCKTIDQSSSKCLVCNQNFYLDLDGTVCKAASPIIPNCIQNQDNSICAVCSSDKALSADKKSCVDKGGFDVNCSKTVIPENLSCSKCKAGQYFFNNVCTEFSQNKLSTGCFWADINDQSKCVFCNTGYYMLDNGSCQNVDGTTTTTTTTKWTGILTVALMIFGLEFQLFI